MTEGDDLPGDVASVPCVGGLVYDAAGRIALIRRGNPPERGRWSLPGGRVETGEDDAAAVIREMAEETGLIVAVGPLVGRVIRGPFHIADYRCTWVGGVLRAGDDAMDARWCTLADMEQLPLVEQLFVTLRNWNALPS